MMKRILVPAFLALLGPLPAQAADPALFHLAVKDAPVENGKVLDIEFKEVERTPDASTVRIIRRSGGSVSSSMFVVRGLCGLARARGQQYVTGERIDKEHMRVTFPDTPPEGGKGFTMAQCELLHY